MIVCLLLFGVVNWCLVIAGGLSIRLFMELVVNLLCGPEKLLISRRHFNAFRRKKETHAYVLSIERVAIANEASQRVVRM